jgi:hypothetical protein
MAVRLGWLAAASGTALVVAFLFISGTGACIDYVPESGKTSHCTTTPMLGNGLTWVIAALAAMFVVYCLARAFARRKP